MNHDQFEEALSLYGGDLSKWPTSLRAEAEPLVATDRQAAELLSAAQHLDGLLGEIAAPTAVDAALIGCILAGIGNGQHHDVTVRPTKRLAALASATMALFLAAGFAAGVALPQDQGEDTLAGLVFGGSASASTYSVEELL